MDPKEYQEAVKITECSYRETAAYFHAKLTPKNRPSFALLHGIMGICDEAGELWSAVCDSDEPNIKEEVGDMLWFITITCRELGIDMSFDWQPTLGWKDKEVTTIMFHACALAGTSKKTIFYGSKQELRALCGSRIVVILSALNSVCRRYGFTLSAAMEANVRKLQKRYGAKFTAEKALHRDRGAEMQAMNGGAR